MDSISKTFCAASDALRTVTAAEIDQTIDHLERSLAVAKRLKRDRERSVRSIDQDVVQEHWWALPHVDRKEHGHRFRLMQVEQFLRDCGYEPAE